MPVLRQSCDDAVDLEPEPATLKDVDALSSRELGSTCILGKCLLISRFILGYDGTLVSFYRKELIHMQNKVRRRSRGHPHTISMPRTTAVHVQHKHKQLLVLTWREPEFPQSGRNA